MLKPAPPPEYPGNPPAAPWTRQDRGGPVGRNGGIVGLPFEWRCGLFPFDTGPGGTVTLRSVSIPTPRPTGIRVDRREERSCPRPARPHRAAADSSSSSRLPRRRRSRATSALDTSSRPASGTSATSPTAPPRCRRSTRASRGPSRRRRRQRLPADLRRQRRQEGTRSRSSRTCSRSPTSSSSPPMRTARARPSPGTSQEILKPKVPVHRMVFHEITKDAIQRGRRQPARAEPAPRRRPGDPPHPRPPLRLRGLAGAVEEGHAAAVGRPRAVRRDPARRRARARAHRVPLRRVLGPDRHLRHRPGR